MHDGVGTDHSVLFSLNELRSLESERIRDEEAAAEERLRAIERAQFAAAEEARRLAEERHRAQAAEKRREADARERARRQQELRLIEAEARLDEETQLRLEAARQEAEARADAELKAARPVGTIVALTVGALIAVGSIGTFLMRSEDRVLEREQAALATELQSERAATLAQKEREARRFTEEMAGLKQRLTQASSQAERQRLAASMAEATVAHQRRAAAARRAEASKKVAAAAPLSALTAGADLLGN